MNNSNLIQKCNVRFEVCTGCIHTHPNHHTEELYRNVFEQIKFELKQQNNQDYIFFVSKNVIPSKYIKHKLIAKQANIYLNKHTKEIVEFPRNGSFEVYVEDYLIFSKLNSKLFPDPINLVIDIKEYLRQKSYKHELKVAQAQFELISINLQKSKNFQPTVSRLYQETQSLMMLSQEIQQPQIQENLLESQKIDANIQEIDKVVQNQQEIKQKFNSNSPQQMRPRVREYFNEGGNHPLSLSKENVKIKSYIDNTTLNVKLNGIKLIQPQQAKQSKIIVETDEFYQSFHQTKINKFKFPSTHIRCKTADLIKKSTYKIKQQQKIEQQIKEAAQDKILIYHNNPKFIQQNIKKKYSQENKLIDHTFLNRNYNFSYYQQLEQILPDNIDRISNWIDSINILPLEIKNKNLQSFLQINDLFSSETSGDFENSLNAFSNPNFLTQQNFYPQQKCQQINQPIRVQTAKQPHKPQPKTQNPKIIPQKKIERKSDRKTQIKERNPLFLTKILEIKSLNIEQDIHISKNGPYKIIPRKSRESSHSRERSSREKNDRKSQSQKNNKNEEKLSRNKHIQKDQINNPGMLTGQIQNQEIKQNIKNYSNDYISPKHVDVYQLINIQKQLVNDKPYQNFFEESLKESSLTDKINEKSNSQEVSEASKDFQFISYKEKTQDNTVEYQKLNSKNL